MRGLARSLVLGAAACFGVGRAAGEEPDRHPLLRIADEKDSGREAALKAWLALPEEERRKQARAALSSEDPALAFAAAVAVSPWSLDLAELRLRSKAMERDPIAWFDPPKALKEVADGHVAFGAPDLPAIWRACVARDPAPETMSNGRLHRPLLPDQVPALVPLLEQAGPVAFRALLDDIRIMADSVGDSPHHDAYLRAFRYGLLRLRAEHDRKKQPKSADVPALTAKPGLPAEFIELARGCWGADGGGFELGGVPEEARREGLKVTSTQGRGPEDWMHRWALRLTPVGEDAPFLVELLESRAPAVTKAWAARAIARLDGRAAGHALARVLGNSGAERVWAAAERAARGDRTAWNGLANAVGLGKEGAAALGMARWRADPIAARTAAWRQLQDGELPRELVFDERWSLAHDHILELAPEHLDGIAARLTTGDAQIVIEMAFFSEIHPDWLSRERAEALAKRWTARAKSVPYLNPDQKKAVALLEALAPEATRAFLRAVATEAEDADVRPVALDLLARLGDAALQDAMLATWPKLGGPDPAVLGRVRTPEVEAFLRARAEDASADQEAEALAVGALAVFYGCPELLAEYFDPLARADEELSAETWAAVKNLVLAKDPIGAVLRRTHGGPFVNGVAERGICGLGLAKDPRVVERLETWRDRREFQLYWVATACLAMQGQEHARSEWRGFLAEARTFLLDDLTYWRLFTLDGDPEWTADWVARLDANCCYGWHAQGAVKASFPTFPFPHYVGNSGRTRRGAEAWFARHKGAFVRSPILEGSIPGPRR